MKSKVLILLLLTVTTSVFAVSESSSQGQNDPWTPGQFLAPADPARVLNNPKSPQPIIYSIGMQTIIKNSIDILSTFGLNILYESYNSHYL